MKPLIRISTELKSLFGQSSSAKAVDKIDIAGACEVEPIYNIVVFSEDDFAILSEHEDRQPDHDAASRKQVVR